MVQQDLIAYRPWRPHNVDGCYQVLSIPPAKPTPSSAIREMTYGIFRRVDS